MCYSQPLHDLMWYDGIWVRSTCVLYRRIQYDRTHTYDIYSVSNQTKTKKIHRGMKGLALWPKPWGHFWGLYCLEKFEVTPKMVRLSTTIASPLSEWTIQFLMKCQARWALTIAINGVITFVHGWGCKPLFFGLWALAPLAPKRTLSLWDCR